jgi:hypothetical protein
MTNKLVLTVVILLCSVQALSQDKPALSEVDRVRLAEAFKLAETLGDHVWKDWSEAPFAVLLVTPEREFLVRHPRPSKDFTLIGHDASLKSEVYFRKRVFGTALLATFPAVGTISTIVIGQAENTDKKSSTPWVVTVLHEHFHQLQDSQPNIYAEIEQLGLSRGDQTGRWMLNYAFPYDSAEVNEQFSHLSRMLAELLQAKNRSILSKNLAAYIEERQKLQKLLNADDYRYLSFQLWKEGLARYTEYRIAKLAAEKFKPSKEFRALKDFTPFENVSDQLLNLTISELAKPSLAANKRVAFYSFGAGEGLLLDRVNPGWQNRYFVDKFYVEKYFIPMK